MGTNKFNIQKLKNVILNPTLTKCYLCHNQINFDIEGWREYGEYDIDPNKGMPSKKDHAKLIGHLKN